MDETIVRIKCRDGSVFAGSQSPPGNPEMVVVLIANVTVDSDSGIDIWEVLCEGRPGNPTGEKMRSQDLGLMITIPGSEVVAIESIVRFTRSRDKMVEMLNSVIEQAAGGGGNAQAINPA